jgi:hypothetical protein
VSPQNQTVGASSSQLAVTLQCVVSGGGNLQVTWYWQNVVIRPGSDVRYNVTTNLVQGTFAYNQSYATLSTLTWTQAVLAQYICNDTNITSLYGGLYSCLFNDTISGRQIKGNISVIIQGINAKFTHIGLSDRAKLFFNLGCCLNLILMKILFNVLHYFL